MKLTCADPACERPQVRTRDGQRWCMYHPDEPAPQLDMLSGKLRQPEQATPLRAAARPAREKKAPAYRSPGRVVPAPAAPVVDPRPVPFEVAASYEDAASRVLDVAVQEAVAGLVQQVSERIDAALDSESMQQPLRAGLPWTTSDAPGGRTVHGAAGDVLGLMDSPGLAATVVQAVNDWVTRTTTPAQEQPAAAADLLGELRTVTATVLDALGADDQPRRVRDAAGRVGRAVAALDDAVAGRPAPTRNITPEGRERMRAAGRRRAAANAAARAVAQESA